MHSLAEQEQRSHKCDSVESKVLTRRTSVGHQHLLPLNSSSKFWSQTWHRAQIQTCVTCCYMKDGHTCSRFPIVGLLKRRGVRECKGGEWQSSFLQGLLLWLLHGHGRSHLLCAGHLQNKTTLEKAKKKLPVGVFGRPRIDRGI